MPISPVYANIFTTAQQGYFQAKPMPAPILSSSKPIAALTWLKDETISRSLNELSQIKFEPDDIKYLNNVGVTLPFMAGKDAVDFIKKSNIRIAFEKTSSKNIHAQYDFSKNLIMLNDMYKNTQDFPVILALAEAILHECGHAKDMDGDSSIQEEINNLGMSAAAHRAYVKKYGDIFKESDELIVKDGVSVYSKLFFDPDPEKKDLVKRIHSKYGYLPVFDMLHPPSRMAFQIKELKPETKIDVKQI